MSLQKKFIHHLIYIAFILQALTPATAQAQEQFRLLDSESVLPIQGATYKYGDQSGMSDFEGVIRFSLEEGQEMEISHLSYGTWKLDHEAILKLLGDQPLYLERITVNLYPVTVIAIKPVEKPSQGVNLAYRDKMAHDGGAVLNRIPAFSSIRKSGNYGFDPVFRGFKYDQLNIVLNGAQGATAACPNRMDPPTSQMAPNMMDRIEVLKGPHALRYGAGFGATVNFIPSRLRFSDEPDVYGRISGGYEQNGAILRSEGQIGFSGKRHDLAFFGSWSRGDDYRDGNGQAVQSGFSRGSFGTNIGLKLSGNQQLRLSGLYNLARDADFPALPMDLRMDDTWMFNARHDIWFDKGNLASWNTTIFGSFVDHLMDNLLKPLEPRMMNATTSAYTGNYGGRTEGSWRFDRGSLFAGADLRVENARGTRIREFLLGPNAGKALEDNAWQDGTITKAGAFAEYHLNRGKMHFIFSGRLEINHSGINDPDGNFSEINPEQSGTQLNPSLSLGGTRSLGNQMKLGLWLGRTQRSGSLTERFINFFPVGQDPYEMIGNPQLRPEINNQVDLTWSLGKANTSLDIDVFVSYMQDFISSAIVPDLSPRIPTSPGVRQFMNIEKAWKTGFELSWTQMIIPSVQYNMAISYTYAEDLEREEPLPEIAPLDLRMALRGDFLNEKFHPEIIFRHALKQARISTEFGETETPAFSLLDIQMTYRIADPVSITLGVHNLFDEQYYEHLSRSVRGTTDPIYAPGRNVFVSASLDF